MSELDYDLAKGMTRADHDLVNAIVVRSEKEGLRIPRDRLSSTLDICACHTQNVKLDLEKFRDEPLHDFVHDFAGIYQHMNRQTHKLEGGFVPRCAAVVAEMAAGEEMMAEAPSEKDAKWKAQMAALGAGVRERCKALGLKGKRRDDETIAYASGFFQAMISEGLMDVEGPNRVMFVVACQGYWFFEER